MTTYTEFIAACGITDESAGDFAFEMQFLPFLEMAEQRPMPPSRWVQREVHEEIMRQLVGYLHHALDDAWKPFEIMARAEKLIDIYVQEQFDELIPLQESIRRTLHTAWRMTRRRFIKAALKCSAEEFPLYLVDARDPKLGVDGPDADADFDAVVQHLDEGGPLFADLRRAKRQ